MSTFVSVISFILVLVLVVLLYIFVLPDSKRATLNKPLLFIHDYFKVKNLVVESIFRFIYVFSVVLILVAGFLNLFEHFFTGLAMIIFSPIICRVTYEFVLLSILLVKNVMEINNHLKGIDTPNSNSMSINLENSASIANTCDKCGTVNSDNSTFCIKCGNKLN